MFSLFSALSNPVRLKILHILKDNQMKASQLSKTLKTSIQNLQRHLNIMLASGLLLKSVEGEIFLSSIGKFSLSWIPALTFIQNNKEYFRMHTFSGIPLEFLRRMGELKNYRLIPSGMELLEIATEYNQNVEKFAYGTVCMMPMEQYEVSSKPISLGAKYRIVLGPNTKIPKGFYDPKKRKQWDNAISSGQIQERFVEFVPITLMITDKAAFVDFATKKTGQSEIDGLFFSKDHSFMKWAIDLSYYYWVKVKKIKPIKIKPTE